MSKGLLGFAAALLAAAGAAFSIVTAPRAAFADTPASEIVTVAPGTGSILSSPSVVGVSGNGGLPNGADCECHSGDCCHVWGRAEYLLWWTKGSPNTAPLVTSVLPGTPTGGNPVPGAIGGAGTSVVLGGSDIDLGTRQGGKFTLGMWFDRAETVGIEGNYIFLGSVTENQQASSLGGLAAPTLMIPFNDVTGTFTGGTPGHSALLPAFGQLFAVPGGLTGPLISHDSLTLTSVLRGAEAYGVFNLGKSGRTRCDTLFGFRYIQLVEELDFTSNNQTTPQAPQAVAFNSSDSFRTSNNFYGGLLGFRLECTPDDGRCGWEGGLFYRADAKLALGGTVERIDIDGSTQTNLGNPALPNAVSYPGGIFAQTTNMGGHDVDHFAVVPEIDLTVGYAVTTWARISLGYDFLYVSDVARPGSQIDSGVNLYRTALVQNANPAIAAPATDPARPGFTGAQSTFWAQGLNLGLECRF